MSSKQLTITKLNEILITELYKSYREKPEDFIDGKTFVEHIRRKFQDQFSISENDFIVSLNSLESKWIIKQEKTAVGGIPLYIKVKSSIVNSFEGFQSGLRKLQKIRTNQANSKIYIQVKFKGYNLTEFDKVRQLINKCAYDDDLYRLLPFLFRLIFEKLLYQIYLKSLNNNQKFLYFSRRPRDFSQLITLFILLKDREFHQYHGGSINQEIITILKEVQKKGNLTVHQIIRQIDKEYIDNWRDKIERALENLLVLYRNLPDNKILIEDVDRLEKIKEVLGIKKKVQATKLFKKDLKNQYKSEITKENQGVMTQCLNSLHNICSELFGIDIGHFDKDSPRLISSLNFLKVYKDLILPLGITYLEKPIKKSTEGFFSFQEGVKILIYVNCEKSLEITFNCFQFKVSKIHNFKIDGIEIHDFEDVSQILKCLRKKWVNNIS